MRDIIRRQSQDETAYIESLFRPRGVLREIHISDLHFGAFDPKRQYDILNDQFISRIRGMKFDIMSVNGDIFDKKFMANSDAVMYASMFMDNIVSICGRTDASLILIHGTRSHDSNQLKMFYHYLGNTSIDMHIVEECAFVYVKGAKILCIPELYGKGREYYEGFLRQPYDQVFMHGMIDNIKLNIKGMESGINSEYAPTFSMKNFEQCSGPMISGHYHTPGCYEKHFYYTGCPYRWAFGEEEDKGFLVMLYNLDTRKHLGRMVKIVSDRYVTVDLDTLLGYDAKSLKTLIDDLRSAGTEHIRIRSRDKMSTERISDVGILKEYYKTDNTIKIDVSNKKKDEEETDERYSKFMYVTDPTIPDETKLLRFINDNEGEGFIGLEELRMLLSPD
jgi:DNA repair exonuclease SbcCD nuclease subunit